MTLVNPVVQKKKYIGGQHK